MEKKKSRQFKFYKIFLPLQAVILIYSSWTFLHRRRVWKNSIYYCYLASYFIYLLKDVSFIQPVSFGSSFRSSKLKRTYGILSHQLEQWHKRMVPLRYYSNRWLVSNKTISLINILFYTIFSISIRSSIITECNYMSQANHDNITYSLFHNYYTYAP